jgi:hypothetical protein
VVVVHKMVEMEALEEEVEVVIELHFQVEQN